MPLICLFYDIFPFAESLSGFSEGSYPYANPATPLFKWFMFCWVGDRQVTFIDFCSLRTLMIRHLAVKCAYVRSNKTKSIFLMIQPTMVCSAVGIGVLDPDYTEPHVRIQPEKNLMVPIGFLWRDSFIPLFFYSFILISFYSCLFYFLSIFLCRHFW